MAFPFGSIKRVRDTHSVRVVISKKVCPKAVDRNLLRRRIRAIIREAQQEKPRGLTVYPNKKALEVSFAELKRELGKVLHTL